VPLWGDGIDASRGGDAVTRRIVAGTRDGPPVEAGRREADAWHEPGAGREPGSLQEDLQCELDRAAAPEQLDREMQVDVV
jgi:hypothetical protein